ncbi:complement C1q tumor necrosis factor-related protein 5-like [Ruditapes philippinarum]|uniref:complement C1q tumor necrosis factor-related protein 5-like n=1 Tax=Ruditapes philippinarum TaxID=129788 RepID=UPI00295B8C00|nr:complement C1q tumor necrosis factor-related protein 5-like [Ruditapes philippinarum]
MVNEIKKTEDNVISTLGDIKRAVSDFTDMFADMKENISNELLKGGDEIKRREGKLERPPIAFHANYLTDLVHDTTDEIVIFTKSVINEGTGYDTSTGIFTAPVGGLYQFSVHTCVFRGYYAFIGLVLDGKVIAGGSNYDKDSYTCSTVGAIVRVRSGEKVWVKSRSSSSNNQLYQDAMKMNTFSGVLVNN